MITDILRPVAICLLLLMAEVIIYPWIIIRGWSPDLLLIYVLLFASRNGKNAGLLIGLFAGLLQDITGGVTLGLMALVKSNLGFWFGFWIEKKAIEISPWLLSFIVFVSLLLQDIWTALFALQGSEIGFGIHILGQIIPTGVYSAFIAFLVAIFTGRSVIISKKVNGLR